MNTVGLIVSIVVIVMIILLLYFMREKGSGTEQKMAAPAVPGKVDDLTLVEGIGPKIQALLDLKGIRTYGELAHADVEKLRKILEENNLRIADPTTWPKQGQMLADGKLDELRKYQESLKGGRTV